MMETFGESLTRLIKENALSDLELAQKINVDYQELMAWKKNKMPDMRNPVTWESIRKCAEILYPDQSNRRERERFFRRVWVGGLLNAYMQERGINDEQLAKYIRRLVEHDKSADERKEIARITVWRWRTGSALPNKQQKSIDNCIRVLELSRAEADECWRALGIYEIEPLPVPSGQVLPPLVPVVGKPIAHPAQFFGREDLLRRIYTAWHRIDLQNISVLGKKASGKTSLLRYLKRIVDIHSTELRDDQPLGWAAGWLPYIFKFVLVEFKSRTDWQPELVMHTILDQLHLYDYVPQMLNSTTFIEILLTQKAPVVILMDDVHEALKEQRLTKDFWRTMRSLAQGGLKENLAFLTTSRQDPQEVIQTLRPDLSQDDSPFSNTFNTMELGPFTESEALDLFNHVNHTFSDEEKTTLLTESACWPDALQRRIEKYCDNH